MKSYHIVGQVAVGVDEDEDAIALYWAVGFLHISRPYSFHSR